MTVSLPMRLERLEVLRYGRFTDRILEFPESTPDFHLILGANEAGKSTVRAAIADLLFGIETRTAYAFTHDYDALRLGGIVAAGGRREYFQRLKRSRNPLRDAQGRPLGDDLLLPWLGELDRHSYERMFCLDHERLIRGGDEILTARDDLARLLFETSSGITGFGELRDALEQEAATLWAKRRAGDRAFYRAADALQEAERELKAATMRARDWAEIEGRMQSSQEALSAARRSSEALEVRRARLERIRRVAPELQKLRGAQAARAPLEGTPRLPRGARSELERAEREIAAADVRLVQAERAREDAARRIGDIVIDRSCLEWAPQIRALADERARTASFAGDIEKRLAELRVKVAAIHRIAGELGWPGDEGELGRMIPPQVIRAAIHELLQEHGALLEAAASAGQALAERREELVALDTQLGVLVPPAIPQALPTALAAAQALGDHGRQLDGARVRVEFEQRHLERLLGQLRPWEGSRGGLRALSLPLEAEALEQQAREGVLLARLETQREELGRAQRELAACEARARHLAGSKRLVTREALEAARRDRDALWQRIRDGSLLLVSGGAALEDAMSNADRLADERYAAANDLARLEHLEETLVELRQRVAGQERAASDLAGELGSLQAGWRARMDSSGLAACTIARFLDWRRVRDECLARDEALSVQESGLAQLREAGRNAATALRAALAAAGVEPGGTGDLESLVAQGANFIRNAESLEVRRTALLAQRQSVLAAIGAFDRRSSRPARSSGSGPIAGASR
ncbi:MAG: AAA family ATPase [Gammaproteobacteria bacterium]|nr:AAA family ATPase [Gammaproteobacteria bacterium]